ncbi:MAG: glycoside hydrolase family 9 protein [Oscillospiraceae bacterium]|nr:glycoside hydrolase family 9 protein [Oscillospiraceae bacterium]
MKKITRKCLSVLTACMMLTAAASSAVPASVFAAENLVTNSTFDKNTTGWGTYSETGGKCKLSCEDGKLALNISAVGQKNYSVQTFFDIIPLYENGVYHVHYEISCTIPRVAEGMIQQNGGTYQAYTWKELKLTDEPLVMDYDFTMAKETDIMTKLVFNCGNQGEELPEHTIYIDNVSVELIDDSAVNKDSGKPYQSPILTNQVGYRPNDAKKAVVRGDGGTDEFKVVNAKNDEVVLTGTLGEEITNSGAKETDRIADFSKLTDAGEYYITCGTLDKSYTFTVAENPYQKLLDDSVRMLYLQRCGVAVEDKDFAHPACHSELATIYHTDEKIDVSGGWHDAGDYGRYVVPGAKAVADLLYAYAANPALYSDKIGIPESGNGIADVLDEARFELEWMLKMQAASGGVYHKVSCATFPAYVAPEKETDELIVTPISSTATADFCGAMALAAESYAEVDADFAKKCADAAKKAWDYLKANPKFDFTNPSDIVTGDYGDKSDADERYWAACQMYRLTKDATYLDGVSVETGLGWADMGDYGNLAILTMKDADKESATYQTALRKIVSQADTYKTTTAKSPYGSPVSSYRWGSNMDVADAGVMLGLAYRATGDASYLEAAQENLNYLLGRNPLGTCFVTGYGTVSPQKPHHRPSMAVGKAMPGMLVGGVDSALEDSAAKAYLRDEPPAKCYVDNSESYSTNEITIYWNSPLTYLLTLTEESASQPAEKKAGDVNLDNKLSIADAVLLQKYLVTEEVTLKDWSVADLNGDKTLNAVDLTLLLRKLL